MLKFIADSVSVGITGQIEQKNHWSVFVHSSSGSYRPYPLARLMQPQPWPLSSAFLWQYLNKYTANIWVRQNTVKCILIHNISALVFCHFFAVGGLLPFSKQRGQVLVLSYRGKKRERLKIQDEIACSSFLHQNATIHNKWQSSRRKNNRFYSRRSQFSQLMKRKLRNSLHLSSTLIGNLH